MMTFTKPSEIGLLPSSSAFILTVCFLM